MKNLFFIISILFLFVSCVKDAVTNSELSGHNYIIESITINDVKQELDYCTSDERISFGSIEFTHSKYGFEEEYGRKTCRVRVVSGNYKAVRNKIEFRTAEGDFSYTATLSKNHLTISGKEKDKKGNEYSFSKTYIKQ